ncbi:hypothetical protein CEXT_227871 [Caerostris extrusa]|uniref:Uncharacterized protein n=1 Tax=Caerostris extrusa TaxID=172846 RepID=A0AAV4UJN6_CAEEX|nr:hypothetical protein CEXT_227871 [Caerostris extrusa]
MRAPSFVSLTIPLHELSSNRFAIFFQVANYQRFCRLPRVNMKGRNRGGRHGQFSLCVPFTKGMDVFRSERAQFKRNQTENYHVHDMSVGLQCFSMELRGMDVVSGGVIGKRGNCKTVPQVAPAEP